jgi:transposase
LEGARPHRSKRSVDVSTAIAINSSYQGKDIDVPIETGATMIERFPAYLGEHVGTSGQIGSVSIDMSPAIIARVEEHLPDERMSCDKFHVVVHAVEDAVCRSPLVMSGEHPTTRFGSS